MNEVQRPVYLDHNATTPVDPRVLEAMLPFLGEYFGNPSSSHHFGDAPRQAIAQARARVAELIGAKPEHIIFTSGGSESNTMAIMGYVGARGIRTGHIISSKIEHPAVLEPLRALERQGFAISLLDVDSRGLVDPADLKRALRPDTVLVSIMHAQNEIGTVQPIAELAAIARERGIAFHCDAAQSCGKIPVDVGEMGVDFLSIAGHKLYAPKGIGALYARHSTQAAIHGAGQEHGRRPGTENVSGIAGLGMACELARRELQQNMETMKRGRDRLYRLLNDQIPLKRNGHPHRCLPNTLNISLPHVESARVLKLASRELAASAGSACHSASSKASAVLEAIGLDPGYAAGVIRLSTGKTTTDEDIDRAAAALVAAWKMAKKPETPV